MSHETEDFFRLGVRVGALSRKKRFSKKLFFDCLAVLEAQFRLPSKRAPRATRTMSMNFLPGAKTQLSTQNHFLRLDVKSFSGVYSRMYRKQVPPAARGPPADPTVSEPA